jgi:hypothetical protein
MGEACNTCGRDDKCEQKTVGKFQKKIPYGNKMGNLCTVVKMRRFPLTIVAVEKQ